MVKQTLKIAGSMFICLVLVLGYGVVWTIQNSGKEETKRKALPDFHFCTLHKAPFNSTNLKRNVAICLFYYDTDCEFCQDEARQLKKRISSFNNVQIVMVSANEPSKIYAFSVSNQLNQYKNISWLFDKDNNFHALFGHAGTPSVYIYNCKHQLIGSHQGEFKMEAILKLLNHDKKS